MNTSALGSPIPNTEHAVTVSIPTWDDLAKYITKDPSILSLMKTGYPRHAIHQRVQELASLCETEYSSSHEKALLLSSKSAADACLTFASSKGIAVRILHLPLPESRPDTQIYCVFFPVESPTDGLPPAAMQFWRLNGQGTSSRLAVYALAHLKPDEVLKLENVPVATESAYRAGNEAKNTIRKRIAGLLNSNAKSPKSVSESNVHLYMNGMAAIWAAQHLCTAVFGERKIVCLGIAFWDSIQFLQIFGGGCQFIPSQDINELRAWLETNPTPLALFLEFPNNPLLQSAPLAELRKLANQYDFPIIIDDTIGNFCNVDVLGREGEKVLADVLVSSLTKSFSGFCDVMGGSMVLNPGSKYFDQLTKAKSTLNDEDTYMGEDAITLEHNSRDLAQRNKIMDANAELIVDYLHASKSPAISKILYPKYSNDIDNFKEYRREGATGYGCLFSVILSSVEAAKAFLDALPAEKGPSLGTNFTISIPFGMPLQLNPDAKEWATKSGIVIPDSLVRVSVGLEDGELLKEGFERALGEAEKAVADGR